MSDTDDGDYAVLRSLDGRDKDVKEAALAYLMWHSGEVLPKDLYADRASRARRIDELGEEAINRHPNPQSILSDSQRVMATRSIASQAAASREVNQQVIRCFLDVDMILSGAMIPVFEGSAEYNYNTPSELRGVGLDFDSHEAFRRSYENFGRFLITDPMTVFHMLEHLQHLFLDKSIVDYSSLSEFYAILPYWNIISLPDRCRMTFDGVARTPSSGRSLTIRGQVGEVAESLSVLTKIAYRCKGFPIINGEKSNRHCNRIEVTAQNSTDGNRVSPGECSRCKSTNAWEIMDSSDKSRLEPIQRLTIQEMNITEEGRTLVVELRGPLTELVKPGDTVEVTGVLRLDPISKASTLMSQYILATSIKRVEDDSAILLTDSDREDIQDFLKSLSFKDRMQFVCEAWAGHIVCDPSLKHALTLQAVGVPYVPNSADLGQRTGMHILLAGDPGTAKTFLLKSQINLVSGSRYASAEGATAAGLTAAAVQIEDLYTKQKKWKLLPGVLALVPRDGVCAIDEFNLYKGNYGDFQTAMESGFTMVTKVVKGRIPTPCSVLAGANPNNGVQKKFVKGKDYFSQLGMEIPMAQRFDCIFIMLDSADEAIDGAIADSVIEGVRIDDSEMDFIRKYIQSAKEICPRITKEAARYIKDQHVAKRQATKDGMYIRSHRQVPALKRFAIATARFDHSDTVTKEHVMFAEEILSKSLNEMEPSQIDGGITEDQIEKIDKAIALIKTHLKEIKAKSLKIDDAIVHLTSKNVYFEDKDLIAAVRSSSELDYRSRTKEITSTGESSFTTRSV